MRKQVGNIVLHTTPGSDWVQIEYQCNDYVSTSIHLRSKADVLDLQYALASAVRVIESDERPIAKVE
jgi:hypothetical protein